MKIDNIFVNDPESGEYQICVVEKVSRRWKRIHYFYCEYYSDESSGNYEKHYRHTTISRVSDSWVRSCNVGEILDEGIWKKSSDIPNCLYVLLEDLTLACVEEIYQGCETSTSSW